MDGFAVVIGEDGPRRAARQGRFAAQLLGIRIAAVIAPPMAARWAERVWFRVPPRVVHPDNLAFLRTGNSLPLIVDGLPIAAWKWGRGRPVLLVHGWGGNASDMRSFVEPLVERGYEVTAFDAPRHGATGSTHTARGRGLLDAVPILLELQRELGDIEAVVAHSGGATVVASALREGLRIRRLALVAPLNDFRAYAERFCHHLGLKQWATRSWMERVERRVGRQWDDLAVSATPDAVDTPPVLVIHDHGDREVPFEHALDIARTWPLASLRPVHALGHRRLLQDRDVVASIASFIAGCDEAPIQ